MSQQPVFTDNEARNETSIIDIHVMTQNSFNILTESVIGGPI